MSIGLDFSGAWCVEEREIEWLKARGRSQSKKRRRNIGRAIRYWQKRLATGTRSLSVPVYGRLSLRKYGRAIDMTYELLKPRDAIVVFDEYADSGACVGLSLMPEAVTCTCGTTAATVALGTRTRQSATPKSSIRKVDGRLNFHADNCN